MRKPFLLTLTASLFIFILASGEAAADNKYKGTIAKIDPVKASAIVDIDQPAKGKKKKIRIVVHAKTEYDKIKYLTDLSEGDYVFVEAKRDHVTGQLMANKIKFKK